VGVKTDTRERMVNSAAVLLREHGVAGTSIAKVLGHSSGPRGSVGFHFPGGRAELLTDALQLAGDVVTSTLQQATEHGVSPTDVFAGICEHYKAQLAGSDFAAGCPVGAAAQEAYRDPTLGPVVSTIVDDWASALADALIGAGHRPSQAANLAMFCISSLEGAITMSRVTRSTDPLDSVLTYVVPLLRVR
jgi:TetR/AcrR family transcriptional repressor of lmrAB and yxaGH operons